jgi:predicted GH43/DUF377 family glycosyl hydrolase
MKGLPVLFLDVALAFALFGECGLAQYVWTNSPSPVFTGSATESWNKEVWAPSVLFNSDSSRYEMWFSTCPGPEVNWKPYQIGFAISKDGISWARVGSSPVLAAIPGTWQANVCNPSVLREGGSYKMWYAASMLGPYDSCFIAYATSPDGITWTRYAGDTLLRPGPAVWESNCLSDPFVIHSGGMYQMWYDAGPSDLPTSRIGKMTSLNGIHWTRDSIHNPVLDMGGVGQWDQGPVGFPRVFSMKDTMFMCYTCFQSPGDLRRIGLARSTDGGTVWQKWGQGPILSPGASGGWDQSFVQEGLIVTFGNTLRMLYTGYNSATHLNAIGQATTIVGIVDPESSLPDRFMLAQNYPNPFNPSTTIQYTVGGNRGKGIGVSDVSLIVYDVLGREVAMLVNDKKAPGSYEVRFDGSGLASGVYIYRLTAGTFVASRAMLLLK